MKNSIWPKDDALTGTTTPGQSGPESNCNEHSPNFKSEAGAYHTQDTQSLVFFFDDIDP